METVGKGTFAEEVVSPPLSPSLTGESVPAPAVGVGASLVGDVELATAASALDRAFKYDENRDTLTPSSIPQDVVATKKLPPDSASWPAILSYPKASPEWPQ